MSRFKKKAVHQMVGAPGQANKRRSSLVLAALLLAATGSSGVHAGTITRTSAFEYDSAGMLSKEIVEPASSDLCVVTTYVLDSFGNRTSATTRNCAGQSSEAAAPASGSLSIFDSRTVSTGYSSDGRFPISNTNALGQGETKTYDPVLGVLTSLTGPNGLTTSWAYDGFGRKVLEKRADGNGTRWKYEYCSPINSSTVSCTTVPAAVQSGTTVSGSVAVAPAYVITSTPVKQAVITVGTTGSSTDGGDGGANGAYSKTYYDTLGRVIRVETQGFDVSGTATLIFQDTSYDSLGHVLAKSRPYYQGATTIYWATYTYDKLDRVLTETMPDGSKTSTSYQGLVTVVTNDKNKTLTETRNVAGQVTTITDAYGKTLSKTYDAYGNLLTTTDVAGNVTTLTYDIKGRKKTMQDPDMGYWTYDYNALGELKQQTDAKSQVTKMTYDLLGRLTKKEEPTQNASWTYDKYAADTSWQTSTCAKGIGKLCEVSTGNTGGNGYGRKHVYDSYGRASSTVSTIGSTTYTASTTYNSDGRVDTVTYPSKDSSGNVLLQLKNVYTALGYLKQVINANAPSSIYWKAESMDAEGHLLQQTTGNLITTAYAYDPQTGRLKTIKAGATGSNSYAVQNASYDYDTLGNLKSSADSAVGASATYTYDDVNRLLTESRFGTGVTAGQTISWTYYDIGNIKTRTDASTVLTYNYPSSGASSVRPHAVSSVTGTVNGLSNPGYSYDADGNITSSAGRTVTWTSFNKVNTITQTSSATVLAYLYDAEGDRAKETYTKNGTLQRTTIYLNPGAGAGLFYEEEITPAGTKKKHYLNAGGSTFGVLIWDTATSAWTTQYWHKDNLGSTVAVTDASGAVTERMSYEPFGKHRNTNATTDLLGTLTTTTTKRGFTGHEMMDEVGLVNMNGRVYDPAIARFLSADPYIQAPGALQSYNRYSYVWNNPLNATDPTGYWSLAKFVEARWKFAHNPSADNFYATVRTAPGSKYVKSMEINLGCTAAGAGNAAATAACIGAGQAILAKSYGASNKDAFRTGVIAGASSYASDYIDHSGWNPSTKFLADKTLDGTVRVASGGQFWEGVRGSFAITPERVVFGLMRAYGEYDRMLKNIDSSDLVSYQSATVAVGGAGSSAESLLSLIESRIIGVFSFPLMLAGDTSSTDNAERVWYHYTDKVGYDAIMRSGGNILTNNDGRAYATFLLLSVDQAKNAIFMGSPPGYEGKGEYYVSFRLKEGVVLVPSSKPAEFYYPGALRNGRQINLINGGKNDF